MSSLSKWLGKVTDGHIGDNPYPSIAQGYAQQGPGQYGSSAPQWAQPGSFTSPQNFMQDPTQIGQPQGGGGGWQQYLPWIGMGVGAAADIYGAWQQGKTNEANFAAQYAQQQMMNQLVGGYLTPQGQQNPFSAQIMQFLGQQPAGQGGGYNAQSGPSQQPLGYGGSSAFGPRPTVLGRRGDAALAGPADSALATYGGQESNMMAPQSMQQLTQRPQQQQSGMYQYNQNTPAASYDAMQLGQAPQINAPQQQGFNPFAGAQAAGVQGYNPQQLSGAPQIAMPGGINLPQVGGPDAVMPQMVTGTQGANAGQDALLQMMRKDVGAPRDASIDPMLQSGTGSFNNSGLMDALKGQDQMLLDEQVNQLRGSAGSFGQRFGSQMMKQEGKLRNDFATNIAARNAGLQAQSFESAANRNLQGAGIQSGREQFFGQLPFQNAQLQQQAALGAQQGGFQGGQMDLQAQLANQSAGLQAQQFNVGANQGAQQFNAQNAINASLATQGLQAQVGQANAGNSLQAMLANQQAGMQAGLANNQLAAQMGMFNAGNQQQAGMQNQQLQQLMGSQNQNASLQAMLANQGLAGQYGLANQGAYNQAGQFNAGLLQNQNQFGAQQGNAYNQLMMSGMMNAAQLQNQQMGNNMSLLGILGGVGIPQQQVNPMYGAVGDAAGQLGMLPMLMQMMQPQGRR